MSRPARAIDAKSGSTALRPIDADRWEQGSDLELSLDHGSARYPWEGAPHGYWGTGRDALRALLRWGRLAHGWRRLLCPSFFCQPVMAALRLELPVAVYPDAPTAPALRLDTEAGDVVLAVSTFGISPVLTIAGPAMVIEDHSHDLLSAEATDSLAEYAIASLRKTLPLPDGGVAWSPRGLGLPSERPLTSRHARATLDRLSAMTLKLHYLRGGDIAKDDFRRLAAAGERAMGEGAISGISDFTRSRLPTLPVTEWRAVRARNMATLRAGLGDLPGVALLDAPFAATLVFDDARLRDSVRRELIEARVYPAVIWPLEDRAVEGIPAEHIELSRRIFSLHCDHRYSASDMLRVAAAVRKSLGAQP